MKNKIKRFAKGDFHIPQPEIIFPETHIVMRVGEGEKITEEVFALKNSGGRNDQRSCLSLFLSCAV